MRIFLEKTAHGCVASDNEARKALERIKVGTTFEAEIITRKVRSLAWHRRYWLLMSMLAENVEDVDLGNGELMPVNDAEDMHTAMKLLTGHVWIYTTTVNDHTYIVRIPKPTNFREMSSEEWPKYLEKVLRAVHERILPGIGGYLEEELARLAS